MCAALDVHLTHPVCGVILGESAEAGLLDQTQFTQAGLFALEVALFRLLERCGVRPDFLVGHSIGELAAAHVAGVFSLEDACALVTARGRLMGELPEGGAMVSIQASEHEVLQTLAGRADRVALAAVNGPLSVVISGDEDAVLDLADVWGERGRKTKRLRVSHAFHSPRMDGMLEEFAEVARGLSYAPPAIPIVSNLTGEVLSVELCAAEYWVRHVRQPVRFLAGIRWLATQGVCSFLELGPDGVLSAMSQDCLVDRQDVDHGSGGETNRDEAPITAVPTLRPGRPEVHSLFTALGELWVRGVYVDWGTLFMGSGARQVKLPTYAFQRDRYWLKAQAGAGDAMSIGQSAAEHPMLGAALALADGRDWLFAGRLSLDTHPWLADHAVMNAILLPGTAFLELALHAGEQVGCANVQELVLEAPLLLPEQGAVQLQIFVGESDERGQRSVSIHSCPQEAVTDGLIGQEHAWTCHASGLLVSDEQAPGASDFDGHLSVLAGPWPPEGAQTVEVDDLYDILAEGGLKYGPVFQGLVGAWRRGDEVFAEVSLPEQEREQAGLFGMHPALLDAALHVGWVIALDRNGEDSQGANGGGLRLPFSWGGVSLGVRGESSLRVALSSVSDGVLSVLLADQTGRPVASVESLITREVSREQLASARMGHESLFCLNWTPVSAPLIPGTAPDRLAVLNAEGSMLAGSLRQIGIGSDGPADLLSLARAVEDGAAVPALVLVDCTDEAESASNSSCIEAEAVAITAANSRTARVDAAMPVAAHASAHRALHLIQAWLSDERFAVSRLVMVTRGAISVADGTPGSDDWAQASGVPGLTQAPIWGLVRSAQSENPERFVLIDIDDDESSLRALPTAIAIGEPQLAIRAGNAFTARFAKTKSVSKGAASVGTADQSVPSFSPVGTVLITGGTGGLGALMARHLVTEHGVRSLLLASRRGPLAQGASELKSDLETLGAYVTIAACDVSSREELLVLLKAVPQESPLSGVVHAAGVLDDGVTESLTAERVDRVLAPKLDAAWHLHELTEHLDLAMFVLFSSVAGMLGGAGQGNYAAANAFLDALAVHRRSRGLAGISMAWGMWEQASGMTSTLSEGDVARMGRSGTRALSKQEGLELFDAACMLNEPLVVPMRINTASVHAQARAGMLSPLLSGLIRVSSQRTAQHGLLARRLAAISEPEREGVVLELLRGQVAAVLGHASPEAIDPQRAFKELGFDSLAAVELRNRLNTATGLRLPATMVFDYPSPSALASYLVGAVEGLHVRAPVALSVVAADEPVAIVGMSCRYPGGVRSPQELWDLIVSGEDGISGFPNDRGWDLEGLYDPDPDHPGTSYTREGGFLYDAGEFDAGFFGISPKEALAMDPQQRLLLEASWEALEGGGIGVASLRGSQTGVFAGVMYHDYGSGLGSAPADLEGYMGTGMSGSVASGRVAYTFGLEGPAVTVDTACSSSLVALHLACQALRSGECSLALAGGVTVMATPGVFVGFSRQRGLAADGRCKSFADAADGTGWSEGVGVLLLERLSDAERNGHRVLGVVRGSAVNQDGASNGLTAPNGPSQQRVIVQALANARLVASDVDVVEAHGTGTTLGDPIEAQALLATYGQERDRPLWLGSVKSNIGHTQAAAGVAGIIKMVKALEHGVLPPTLHIDQPSTQVDWSAGAVSLLTEEVSWPKNGDPRRAGISSFGISGTNAHVIIEEAPVSDLVVPAAGIDAHGDDGVVSGAGLVGGGDVSGGLLGGGGVLGVVPWVLSGKGVSALRGQAGRLLEHLRADPGFVVGDVGFSLAVGRSVFERRAVVVGSEREGLLGALGALSAGESAAGVIEGGPLVDVGEGVVFCFPGQGSQWGGMAVELLDSSLVFAERMRECAVALEPYVDWSLEDVLRGVGGAPGLDRLDVVQPALFAVMVSLAGLWRACGVEPAMVVGHSQGEIAAAYIAGGLSLEDAALVVALRSRALASLAGRGGMVSVALGVRELEGRLECWEGRVSLAAVNGPSSVVVSGESDALNGFLVACESDGVRARRIPVDYASHSRQIEEIREELLAACAPITPRSGGVPFYSTVTGGLLDTSELDGEYWYRNLRETVRFEEVTGALLARGHRVFVEVSPHPVLTVGVQETVDGVFGDPGEVLVSGSLRRDDGGARRFVSSLAEVWVRGVGVDWGALFVGSGARGVVLPSYAFQRERYWLMGGVGGGDAGAFGQVSSEHPLLGAAVAVAGGEQWLFTGRISLQTHPWLADHAVLGNTLLPGTAFVELALHAGAHSGCEHLHELTLEAPLVLPDQGATQLQVAIAEPDQHGQRTLTIHSRPEQNPDEDQDTHDWTRHATATLTATPAPSNEQATRLADERAATLAGVWPPPDATPIDTDGLYDHLAERAIDYGPAFQGLHAAWQEGEHIYAEIVLPDDQQAQATTFGMHPALLDAALHTMALPLKEHDADKEQPVNLPFSWTNISLHTAGATSLRVCLSPAPTDGSSSRADYSSETESSRAGGVSLLITDESGALLATVDSLIVREISQDQLAIPRQPHHNSLFTINWVTLPDAFPAQQDVASRVAVLSEEDAGLPRALSEAGVSSEVYPDLEHLGEAMDDESQPDTVIVDLTRTPESSSSVDPEQPADGDVVPAAHAVAHWVLRLVQEWLLDERFAASRLVFVTQGAVATRAGGGMPGLAGAPVWGLVRSAQSENPERFVLVDIDGEASWAALPGILAISGDEPQLAIRDGELLAPRLARAAAPADRSSSPAKDGGVLNGQGTVLITGGTGGLGALLARHLVVEHGVRHLLLTSRRGLGAPDAAELQQDLEALGAEVTIAACDAADRGQLAQLLDAVSEESSLIGVVHAAGVIHDGVIGSLTAEHLDRVLTPKVDAAWYLHELTEHLDLKMFVMFSSATATLGTSGQGNYAAANAFLDALAAYRCERGLAGTAVAWGLWAQSSGMTGHLAEADLTRMARSGMGSLSSEEGLELFDTAWTAPEAAVLAMRLDTAALRAQARAGTAPALLRGLIRLPSRRTVNGTDGLLARRLSRASANERERVVLEVVRAQAAIVLEHASGEAIDASRTFKEQGFDSLTAVQFRNLLSVATGMRLSATLVFDYPTPTALAAHLVAELTVLDGNTTSTAAQSPTDEPVAIIGMSCRYPGGVSSSEQLWDLVASGTDAISGFPTDRGWDLEQLLSNPDLDRPRTSSARDGGFVYDAPEFDAGFFGISPREALAMDPQQRLLLEASWEALEDAAIDPQSLRGAQTGVFAGVMHQEYATTLSWVPDGLEGYVGTGSAGSVVSGRVAYTFGLEGPAVSVDTACSSSLVALHLACGALRSGECSLALAGGVTVMATPGTFVEFSRQRGLAPDGRCKSFADAADGAGFSEGVGVLLLERLSDAERNGHRVLGVVRGSAVNQDGASNGLTAPNGPSQQRVIVQALANARLVASDVDVVEAHGTGTTLGDPIEAQALLATYGQERDRPLWLGSVKSNIGHTQAAAGVAGIIKMVKALEHGVLPPTLHIDQPSTQVDWSAGAVSLLTEEVSWPKNGDPRRAGISSFGISGTNAHVIIEEAPVSDLVVPAAGIDAHGDDGVVSGAGLVGGGDVSGGLLGGGGVLGVVPWVLSGKGVSALRGQAGRLLEHLRADPGFVVGDVGFSLAVGRSVFERRAVVVGSEREGLLGALGALSAGESAAGVIEGGPLVDVGEGVVFCFPGQGSQWGGMAVELLDSSLVFAERMRECAVALEPYVDWSLEDVLRGVGGAPGLDRLDVVQPALFAVMVSLAGLWRACGVEPAMVVGHSQGEIAAAYIAGGLSLEDAALVVALRSRALASLAGRGGMVSVALGVRELEGRLECWEGRVSLAAVNGPSSVVVSGESDALNGFLVACESDGVRARRIPVDYASHSRQIEEIREELLAACAPITPRSGGVPFYSTVTGGLLDTSELDGEYWYRNLRETVRFEEVTGALLARGHRVFVEVSPHPVLTVGVQETVDGVFGDPGEVLVSGSLRRDDGGARRFVSSLAEVWVRGVGVDWGALFVGSGARGVVLPSYAFQRERYWLMGGVGGGDAGAFGQVSSEHPLLGAAVAVAGGEQWLFTGRISLQTHPWLADHAVLGNTLLPGTAFVELALHAGAHSGCEHLHELTLEAPLVLPDQGATQLQVAIAEPDQHGQRTLTIHSRPEQNPDEDQDTHDWTRHATATLTATPAPSNEQATRLADERAATLAGVWPPPDATPIDTDGLYDHLAERAIDYGPAFQGLHAAWQEGEHIYAEIVLPDDQQAQATTFGMHPALLDAALHTMALPLKEHDADKEQPVNLPFSWTNISLHTAGATSLRVCLSPATANTGPQPDTDRPTGEAGGVSLVATDASGKLVAAVQSLVVRGISGAQLAAAGGSYHELLLSLDWTPIPVATSRRSTGGQRWAVLDEEGAVIAQTLQAAGLTTSVYPDLESLADETADTKPLPDLVLVHLPAAWRSAPATQESPDVEVIAAASATVHRALHLAQEWLGDERFAGSRLVLVTEGAVAVAVCDGVPDLASAPLWGLVRSAQSEHPGRFMLVDVDGEEASWRALPTSLAVALALDESQLAIRRGSLMAPRVVRLRIPPSTVHGVASPNDDGPITDSHYAANCGVGDDVQRLKGNGTVLITGGTGGLGALVARHLVTEHRVSSLLLVSRRGREAPGAPALEEELTALGAKVVVASCDVTDRPALASLLESQPPGSPLRMVVHAADVRDDGAIDSLTTERVDRVFAAKVHGAWHLHELTTHLELDAFVLFSSTAATFGSPAQSNYAAANAFLDALAAYRRAQGLPATAMAWGDVVDKARQPGSGMAGLSDQQRLSLFDAASVADERFAMLGRLDMTAFRRQANAGQLPPILRKLIRTTTRRVTDGIDGSLAARLASLPKVEHEAMVLKLVQTEVATVLGDPSFETIDTGSPFKDLGFTSLTAVELRNRLQAATELHLPATIVFDYPTTAELARHLTALVAESDTPNLGSIHAELDKLERRLGSMTADEPRLAPVALRLQALLSQLGVSQLQGDEGADEDLHTATDEELFALLESERGA